jgi:hypothetical protein
MKYLSFFIIIAAIVLPGCATYKAPPPAQATCSITVHDTGKSRQRLDIVSIDHTSTEPNGGLGFGLPPSTFMVLPGHHTFRIRYTMAVGLRVGYMKVETEFEPAHSYTLYSDSDGNRFTAWFVDDANGRQIEQKGSTDWKRLLFGNMAQ